MKLSTIHHRNMRPLTKFIKNKCNVTKITWHGQYTKVYISNLADHNYRYIHHDLVKLQEMLAIFIKCQKKAKYFSWYLNKCIYYKCILKELVSIIERASHKRRARLDSRSNAGQAQYYCCPYLHFFLTSIKLTVDWSKYNVGQVHYTNSRGIDYLLRCLVFFFKKGAMQCMYVYLCSLQRKVHNLTVAKCTWERKSVSEK